MTSHYYCTFPGYTENYYPNIRECFTYLVMPSIDATIQGIKPKYDEAYDYCVFMPFNRLKFADNGGFVAVKPQSFPAFIPANKTSGKTIGPLAWIHRNQQDTFDFVMKLRHCSIAPRAQQEILNEYYGVDLQGKVDYTASDSAQVDECRKKRPVVTSNGARATDLNDPLDGTHCSYDMREKKPSPTDNCY